MEFKRIKLIEKFQELLVTNEHQYIIIDAPQEELLLNFLQSLKESWILDSNIPLLHSLTELEDQIASTPNDPLILLDPTLTPEEIRSFIESNSIDSRIIICLEHIESIEWMSNFSIRPITFREYSESIWYPINVGDLMSGTTDMNTLNHIRDEYIHTGSDEINIQDPSQIASRFEEKLTVIKSELFEKEHEVFMDFLRTLAMGIGDLYKEERIAKLMNISRRKVRKYTELLLDHKIIFALGPLVRDAETELSRHVKVYFSDLSSYAQILGAAYGHGFSKKWVIENFILLELQKKLSGTHEIRFYKKKSGAEIPFVLENQESHKLTPIDIHLRSTGVISQALKTFYESYGSEIDYAMVLNDALAEQKEWQGSKVLILPTIAI